MFNAQQKLGFGSIPTVPAVPTIPTVPTVPTEQQHSTAQPAVPTAQQVETPAQQATDNQIPAVQGTQWAPQSGGLQQATVSTDLQTILAGQPNSDEIRLQVHPDGTVTKVPIQPQGSSAFSLASLGINPEVLLPQMPPGVSAAALNCASLEAIYRLSELGKIV